MMSLVFSRVQKSSPSMMKTRLGTGNTWPSSVDIMISSVCGPGIKRESSIVKLNLPMKGTIVLCYV